MSIMRSSRRRARRASHFGTEDAIRSQIVEVQQLIANITPRTLHPDLLEVFVDQLGAVLHQLPDQLLLRVLKETNVGRALQSWRRDVAFPATVRTKAKNLRTSAW